MGIILILFIAMLILYWFIVTRSMSFPKKATVLIIIPIIAAINAVFAKSIAGSVFGCEELTTMAADGSIVSNCSAVANVYGWISLFGLGAILPWGLMTIIYLAAVWFKRTFR